MNRAEFFRAIVGAPAVVALAPTASKAASREPWWVDLRAARASDPRLLCPPWEILCDGEALGHCFAADQRTGVAKCYATDADGKLSIELDDVRVIVRRGHLEIRRPRREGEARCVEVTDLSDKIRRYEVWR